MKKAKKQLIEEVMARMEELVKDASVLKELLDQADETILKNFALQPLPIVVPISLIGAISPVAQKYLKD